MISFQNILLKRIELERIGLEHILLEIIGKGKIVQCKQKYHVQFGNIPFSSRQQQSSNELTATKAITKLALSGAIFQFFVRSPVWKSNLKSIPA